MTISPKRTLILLGSITAGVILYKLIKNRKAKPKALSGVDNMGDEPLGNVDTWTVKADPKTSKVGSERKKSNEKMGKERSQMLTWTSKVRAPSWSLPAIGTCPSACGFKKIRSPKDIPKKCVGCYAFAAGNYRNPEVKMALNRRWAWFDHTPDEEVIDTLVKALSEAGDDECSWKHADPDDRWKCRIRKRGKNDQKICERKDEVTCKRSPKATPHLVRLFDSGDFHDARAVRIWRKVAQRMPSTKFWAPTTAWVKLDKMEDPAEAAAFKVELRELAKMSNVAVKPSSEEFNKPAPRVDIGYHEEITGTAILTWRPVTIETSRCPWENEDQKVSSCTRTIRQFTKATDENGDPIRYDENDDTSYPTYAYLDGVKHWVCPGDCSKCRMCWSKKSRVAYIQHGPDVENPEKELIRRGEIHSYLSSYFPQYIDIGPYGASGTEHPALVYLGDPETTRRLEEADVKRRATHARKKAEKAAAAAAAASAGDQ